MENEIVDAIIPRNNYELNIVLSWIHYILYLMNQMAISVCMKKNDNQYF